MLKSRSGLRKIAALITIALSALTLQTTAVAPASATDNAPATLAFIDKAFNANQEIVLYGNTEYGLTIEALLQRKAGGYSLVKQLPAVKRILVDRTVVGNNKVGYLYTKDGALRTGRAGLFLFASNALGVANRPLQLSVFNELKAAIAPNGSIALANGNSVEYAWVVLGLHAFKQDALANRVLTFLQSKANSDGGFAGWSATSSIDGTGLTLQAMAALRNYGGAKVVADRKTAIVKAAAYLRGVQVSGSYWQSDNGDGTFSPDPNGTAYAAMGLKSVGANITRVSAWLKTQVVIDGGIKSAWSNGAGDVFATAQAYAPMIGKTYLELLPKRK